MPRLVVVGAGGHGKVVVATARALGWTVAVVDDDRACWGRDLLGATIAGPVAEVLCDAEATCVLAIGANPVRARLARDARCAFATLVHPSAVIHESVALGAGTVVFAGAVVQPDTRIGPHGIVNTGASIDHDCVLGVAVHVAPGVRLAGGVVVGDEAFIGIGAVAIPNTRIGARATIGAGAAVIHDIPSDVIAVGIPARPRTAR